jgi:predicted RNA-binding Zn-ribbon protein involved in translation (DUF1610 family)
MYQPHAHHVLMFLGTFIALWSISLVARGLLHRPRVGPPPAVGPRKIKKPAVIAGLVGFPVGVGVLISGMWLRYWIFGREADPSGLTAFHAVAAGIVAFAAALAAWGLFVDRAKRTLRCPKCWYDMASVASTSRFTCPECGHDAKATHNLQRTRRHWKLVTLAAFIAFAGLLAPRFANIPRGGIKSVLPTTWFISAYWRLPDSWVRNTNLDDEWTMDRRLEESNSWAWQRSWFASKIRSEVRSPTRLHRLMRATEPDNLYSVVKDDDFRPETFMFVARQLGSPDAETRQSAAVFLEGGLGFYSINKSRRGVYWKVRERAMEQIAQHADEISRGLADDNLSVLLETCFILTEAKVKDQEVTDALIAAYPSITGTEVSITASLMLLSAGERHERAADAVLQRANDPSSRLSGPAWEAIAAQADDKALPPKLLARVDQELRVWTHPDRFTFAAIVRLSTPNADEGLQAHVQSIASTPGSQRVAALKAFRSIDNPYHKIRREHLRLPLIRAALTDPDPEVLKVAIEWIQLLTWDKIAGYETFLVDLEPLIGYRDQLIRHQAADTIAAIKETLEAEREAADAEKSSLPEAPDR